MAYLGYDKLTVRRPPSNWLKANSTVTTFVASVCAQRQRERRISLSIEGSKSVSHVQSPKPRSVPASQSISYFPCCARTISSRLRMPSASPVGRILVLRVGCHNRSWSTAVTTAQTTRIRDPAADFCPASPLLRVGVSLVRRPVGSP
jgi:hypothetical protein